MFGEVVFNTSMTGYQEILTDPSYNGQIVAMTYPLIGNYGVAPQDVESDRVALKGFVIRELCQKPSNFRSEMSLDAYLKKHNIVGIEGVDTRALVRRIRVHGAMTGILSTTELDDAELVKRAQSSPSLVGRDLIRDVMPAGESEWNQGLDEYSRSPVTPFVGALSEDGQNQYHVVALDYGMKWNIPRHLHEMGCRVTILPGTATADEVLSHNPDGIFLSNGPGDPEPLEYAVNTIRALLGKKPIFGICLGHQLLGLALGGKTFKLKFGHRGANQPVLNRATGRVEITSQNHGFAIDPDSLPAGTEITHINLNDQTVEGLRCSDCNAFSVQYHPEASAGPHDSHYLFGEFRKLMAN